MSSLSPRLRSTLLYLRDKSRDILPDTLRARLPPQKGRHITLATLGHAPDAQQSVGSTLLSPRFGGSPAHHQPRSGYPRRWDDLEKQTVSRDHRVFVLGLRDASVSGVFPAVVSNDGRLVVELSQVHSEPIDTHPTYSRVRLPAPTHLSGKTLLLASAYGGSFYHWLIDSLPRLHLLARANVPLETFDHVVLSAEGGPFIEEGLSAFPSLRARRHVLNDLTHFRCDELICPSLPQPVGQCSRWVPPFLRRTFLGRNNRIATERLLLSRARAPRRRLTNEDELWHDLLEPAGFTRIVLENLPLREQAELVSRASTIVAPHGAALTHMAFATRGCSIIELLSDAYPASCFWNLADAAGHSYRYVVGESAIDNDAPRPSLNFSIDPVLLRECLMDAEISPVASSLQT